MIFRNLSKKLFNITNESNSQNSFKIYFSLFNLSPLLRIFKIFVRRNLLEARINHIYYYLLIVSEDL
jgi:hypothetical protein